MKLLAFHGSLGSRGSNGSSRQLESITDAKVTINIIFLGVILYAPFSFKGMVVNLIFIFQVK